MHKDSCAPYLQLQNSWGNAFKPEVPYQYSGSEASTAKPIQVTHLLGRRVTLATVESITECIRLSVIENRRITIANFNANSFNLTMQLPWFYEFLQGSEITHCDGFGILKAFSLLGIKVPPEYRVSYTSLLPHLLSLCNDAKFSVFLLGASESNLKLAIQNLEHSYPNATFVGHHGYFDIESQEDNRKVIDQINQVKPNVLLVGMGMPRQESWVLRYRDCLHTNAILLGGAAIDRLAGAVEACPGFLSDVGLEWLYRLVKEPRRLANRYLIGNPAFLFQVALARSYQDKCRSESSLGKTVKDFGLVTGDQLSCLDCVRSLTTEMKIRVLDDADSEQDSRLGARLVSAGLLSQLDVDRALTEQCFTGVRLGDVLVGRGLMKRETVEFLARNIQSA